MANCSGCESTKGLAGIRRQTLPAGSFPANAFGLHDTAGNVWEWVQDCKHESYAGDPPADGSAWEEEGGGDCGQRVLRGGSWFYGPVDLRSALRGWNYAVARGNDMGFRLAQDP
jgi:formylglycine-generating enzyme required for sulfatase activity